MVMPLLPLRDTVVFPFMIANMNVGRTSSLHLVEDVKEEGIEFCVIKQKDHEVDHPKQKDLYKVGTVCRIQKVIKFPDKTVNLIVQGLYRVKMVRVVSAKPYMKVEVKEIEEKLDKGDKVEAIKRVVLNSFITMLASSPYLSEDLHTIVLNIDHPGKFADFIISNIIIPLHEKQQLLGISSCYKRLEHLAGILNREIDLLELGSKIESKVRTELDKTQKEYVLREQMEVIRKELGEDAEGDSELAELEASLHALKLPDNVKKEVFRELDRFKSMGFTTPEHMITRTYLEWIIDLPWSKFSTENLNINTAQKRLDKDHFDLQKVKERILEFLAVRKLKGESTGTILCFVGPPGVGKTSLGKSIAGALNRSFVRISLGGIKDEAEIRGHRKTYIGAMPGKIVQGMKRAGSSNPVFMLDELDKVGADFRGDPSSALLEVLDPQQNSEFIDHFLDVPYDLSKVMFIATANVVDTIPPALRDRLEFIEIPGYTVEEKVEIAWKYLLPKMQGKTGVKRSNIKITKSTLEKIIVDYTREAGVRNLEREIATIFRKIARKITQEEPKKCLPCTVSAKNITDFLGPLKYYYEVDERLKDPGISVGLAWTETGGEIMFIEATKMKGANKLLLTGQLGDVMRESAQAALSLLKSNADELGIDEKSFADIDIHIHVPAGAIPKDGPSAGIALFCALVSLFKGVPVGAATAMTGEITLRGKIMPIGGVKEKVLAARRSGIKRILLPEQNRKDLEEDIPESLRNSLEFVFVDRIEQVLDHVFGGALKGRKLSGKTKSTAARKRT